MEGVAGVCCGRRVSKISSPSLLSVGVGSEVGCLIRFIKLCTIGTYSKPKSINFQHFKLFTMARITRSTAKKNTKLYVLPNSSLSSRRRVRRLQPAAASPKRQPPKKQHSYRSQGTQTDPPVDPPVLKNTRAPPSPPTVLSTGDRVAVVVALLRQFGWSFATFIEHYVTAPYCTPDTPDRRAKNLWKAVFQNPNVEQQLLLHGGQLLGRLHHEPLCRQIKRELKSLRYIFAWWGGRIALAQSDEEEPVEITFDEIVADAQNTAPTLWNFLTDINRPISAIDSP